MYTYHLYENEVLGPECPVTHKIFIWENMHFWVINVEFLRFGNR